MSPHQPTPLLLLEWLAAPGGNDPPPRLKLWAAAFDEWLAESRRRLRSNAPDRYLSDWRLLLKQSPKMPWEMSPQHIEAHLDWMRECGYSPNTIRSASASFAGFFTWCSARMVDQECEPGFNPAAGVPRPRQPPVYTAALLSQEELDRLFEILRQDRSRTARRDYAFYLARMCLGVPSKALVELKWGQIFLQDNAAWVRWQHDEMPLPCEVWQAIKAYLQHSGRWEAIADAEFIFAPLTRSVRLASGKQAEDWQVDRCLTTGIFSQNLKLYGQLAGIPRHKLNMQTLRRTALRLRLNEDPSLAEMHEFIGVRRPSTDTHNRLQFLPELPPNADKTGPLPLPPVEDRDPFGGQKTYVHGFYANSQPPAAVEAVLSENLKGVEAEFVGLRMLGRGLLAYLQHPHDNTSAAQVANAYTRIAARLAEMVRVETQLASDDDRFSWALKIMQNISRPSPDADPVPIPPEEIAAILQLEPGLPVESRRLQEEIASVRYVLRNLFAHAMDAADIREYISAVEKYSQGCIRLLRLLRQEGGDGSRLEAFVHRMIQIAFEEVWKDLGIVPEP